jgi:23S rRNA (adenine2030-N6)-methyltransferase
MNYRHIYHAGGFADVFKHCILIQLLKKMALKDKGFCYIDSHAGVGRYDLTSPETKMSPEYRHGITKFLRRTDVIPALKAYREFIKSLQENERINCYPGSPMIAEHFTRPQDELILNELHPKDFDQLKYNMHGDKRIHCHERDAYEFLPAVLPPKLKRACILIDPAYEKPNEFDSILWTLEKCWQRFSQGVYMIWYPIIALRDKIISQQQNFVKKVASSSIGPKLICEMVLGEFDAEKVGAIGCGIIMINPPWQIENDIRVIAKYLLETFRKDQRGWQRTDLIK